MSYLGTLKTLLYKFIIQWFGVSAVTVRLPMLIAGAATVWLFASLLRRAAGARTGTIGCFLLAADSIYLLTICYDWGPVALQHLLIIAGCLLIVRFYQEGRERDLFIGFLLLGLAVWDKALALWMLSGIGVGCLAVAARQVFAATNARRLGIAAAGFCLGASPFLIYNTTHRFGTLRENSARNFSEIAGRTAQFRRTLDGQGMFGWMTEEDRDTPMPHVPSSAVEQLSAGISSTAGHPRENLMLYGLLLAVLLAPLARGPELRVILFTVVAGAVAWLQMATTANAGGSVHHIILLWPLPAMLIAVSVAAASRRLGRMGVAAAAAVTLLLAGSELLVTNEYYAQMVRNGGTVTWSRGVYTLSEYLKGTPAKTVSCVDWGILDSLRLLNRGRLPLRWGGDETEASLPELVEQGGIFVGHPAGREVFQGKTDRLVRIANGLGYRREMLAVIGDGFGRQEFEVYKFERFAISQ